MKAGALRNFVTIEQPNEVFDSNGELIIQWVNFTSVFASIEPLIGREMWASKQTNATVTGKIRMRFINNLSPKMRIKFNDIYFNIEGIVNVEEKNTEIVIYYSEVA